MKRTKLIALLSAFLAPEPCAEAETLYRTGKSSDTVTTTWLPGIAWSEKVTADIGDCMYAEDDTIVFSSKNVDNKLALTNCDVWNDQVTLTKVHSVCFDSYVEFNAAYIELTRDDLKAQSIYHGDNSDGFGLWYGVRVTWTEGVCDLGNWDAYGIRSKLPVAG